eukprot:Skav231641  [mRNA]  locus=scaffold1144:23243:29283:- [translate_table: standard]
MALHGTAQANYGRGYSMLVNMGYTGGGPTPLCGVLRVPRAGLQEDEAMVVDASAKRGLKRRLLGLASRMLEKLLKEAEADEREEDDDEEMEEHDEDDGRAALKKINNKTARFARACEEARDIDTSVPVNSQVS